MGFALTEQVDLQLHFGPCLNDDGQDILKALLLILYLDTAQQRITVSFPVANEDTSPEMCILLLLLYFFNFTLPTYAQVATGNLTIYSSNKVPKVSSNSTQNEKNYTAPYFPLLGFKQYPGNPILGPNPDAYWESAYLYNPAAIVIDDKVWLLYRAQNKSLISSVGLAWSTDGYNFTRYTKPILFPTEPYETHGTEDPRVVRVNGTFYLTYTGFDGTLARLCIATSTDLVSWTKHGPILPNCTDVNYRWDLPIAAYTTRQGWSKSGAIISEKINGLYQMQWGVRHLIKTIIERS